jgi:hypothetical protein
MRRLVLFVAVLAILASGVVAQENETPVVILAPSPVPVIVAPSIKPPAPPEGTAAVIDGTTIPVVALDPLAAGTGAEGWVWAMRYWSPPAEPRDLAGGRIQAQLGVGRWGYAFRGDISGLPGEFSPDKPETFRSLEGHVAVHRNFAGAQGVKVGAAVGAGAGFSLEKQDGAAPTTPHSATWGAGLHASGDGWWAYALFGQHQALPGFAGVVTYQVRASSRTAAVGTFAVGEHGAYVAQFGIAVRWF